MRFLNLRLENWRNFKEIDIPLQKRIFIIGPNASGKSNFLDSIRFLQDLSSEGGGLREAVNRRQGVSKIRCLAARKNPKVAIEVTVGDDDLQKWRYRIKFNQDNMRRAIIEEEIVQENEKILLHRPNKQDNRDPELLTQSHLEQVSANKYFRELVNFFRSIRYYHLVPQLVRDPSRYKSRDQDPFGSDFLEQLKRANDKTRGSRFKQIEKALKIALPQLKELKITRDEQTGTPHLEGLYENWRPNAGWQREDQFSDGTLRLLGLLWSAMDGSGPLLLEEPELSLHTEVVRHFPQMIAKISRKRGRQVFISTHSEEMLSDPGLALDEIIILTPSPEGTKAMIAQQSKDIRNSYKSGVPIVDLVVPRTAPANAQQLDLLDFNQND